MTDDQLGPVPQNKIYRPFAIQLATFLGGPLAAGYLIAENFKLLGEPEKIKLTWIHTVLATAVIYTAIFVIPELKNIPPFIFPILYSGVASFLVQRYQGNKIREHFVNGGQFYPTWRALLVSVVAAIATVIILYMVLVLTNNELIQKMPH
jgi:hypothetical protein